MAERKKLKISLGTLLAESMKASGVEKYENVRFEVDSDTLIISYNEPELRSAKQFIGVGFSVSDIVLMSPANDEGREIIVKYGMIWKSQPFSTEEKFFLVPLNPKLQGKFAGTASQKECSTYTRSFLKVRDPSMVCMAVHKFVDAKNFHWKEFDK